MAAPGASTCPNGDTRAPGAIPELEALLPRGLIERSPDTVDSGSNCSPAALGTFVSHGVAEVRFAGATWDHGDGDATAIAVLTLPSGQLDARWVEEFYEYGARTGRRTDNVAVSRPVMEEAGQVWRLDALNELSLQTVVVWPTGPYARVVIVATTVGPGASRADHDQRVDVAVGVAAAVPTPTG